jgi:Recombination endonuclease VII
VTKSDAPSGTKRCKHCQVVKPVDDFSSDRKENPERHRARQREDLESGKKAISNRKSHLKRKYGLTLEDFDRMLAEQGGDCAICGKTEVDNVDVDHSTGAARGLLYFRCNAAIGQLDHEPERARELAAYLERDDELATVARDRAAALTSA